VAGSVVWDGATVSGLGVTVVALVCSSTSAATWVDMVIDGKGALPALRAVQEATRHHLGLPTDDAARGWPRRARLRGLIPRLDVGFGTDADRDIRRSLTTSLARTTTEGRAVDFEVAARWNLGEVVFSDAELRASREAIARFAAIRIAMDRVTRIYFERVSVLAKLRDKPTETLRIESARLEALMNAMTGGEVAAVGGKR
jgi:hypothetical protein